MPQDPAQQPDKQKYQLFAGVMAVYKVKNTDSPLSTVEFSPVPEGNIAFFSARDAHSAHAVYALAANLGQTIMGETELEGRTILITRGPRSQTEILTSLAQSGHETQLQHKAKSLDTWKVIAMLAVPGQLLQLTSSLIRKNKRVDWGLFFFATSNLVGHAITWMYGAQKSEDPHRLAFVKNEVNNHLSEYLPAGDSLPSISDNRKSLHGDKPPPTAGQRMDRFFQKNSIYVGEIGCRYAGALALAFPANRVRRSCLKAKSLPEAYQIARNESNLAHFAGLTSVAGKTLSLTSLPADLYSPTPPTALDHFRQKVTFRAGGWMEAGAFGTLTYDALTNPNRRIMVGGREYRDYVGAVGSALFTARYIARHWAKFGERKVDMDEVYAHTTDCLAKMPRAELPNLVADTASYLTNHFKDNQLEFGKVYTRLETELYKYHHISLAPQPHLQESEALTRYRDQHRSREVNRPASYAALVRSPAAESMARSA